MTSIHQIRRKLIDISLIIDKIQKLWIVGIPAKTQLFLVKESQFGLKAKIVWYVHIQILLSFEFQLQMS